MNPKLPYTAIGDERERPVTCPYCVRRYRLPLRLLGPGGAQIRCPGCGGTYVLLTWTGATRGRSSTRLPDPLPETQIKREAPVESSGFDFAGPQPRVAPPPAEKRVDPTELAEQVIGTLASETGDQLAEAQSRGRLFAEFGPRLLDAFDHYLREAGEKADRRIFRGVLMKRCGVDLPAID